MPTSSSTPGWQELAPKSPPAVEEPPAKHGIVEKAGEVVQTVLGTMAGVVTGIGILVTGTEAEKKARKAEAKRAAAKKTANRTRAKKAPAKKATTRKAVPIKVTAKKTAKKSRGKTVAIPKAPARKAAAKRVAKA